VGKNQDSAPDRLAKYVNVWAQPFSCQQLMPDPFETESVWRRSARNLDRNRGRRTSGRTRKRRIARENKRGLGMGRVKSSGNSEKEEKNEVHGGEMLGRDS